MIHTDAIEETEEPPKKLKVEIVEENESQTPKAALKAEIEEVEPEPPQKVEPKETVDQPKVPEGGL